MSMLEESLWREAARAIAAQLVPGQVFVGAVQSWGGGVEMVLSNAADAVPDSTYNIIRFFPDGMAELDHTDNPEQYVQNSPAVITPGA